MDDNHVDNNFASSVSPRDFASNSGSYVTHGSIFARLEAAAPRERELAWGEFRAQYAPIIAAFATKCGANRQDIDDIIQDVLTSFLATQGEFAYDRSKGRFRSYLKTCTIRAAIRRAGKNLRFRGIPLDEIPQIELAIEPVWNDVWEQELVSRALRIIKHECDNNLTFRAFEQYVLLDRTAEVVATELGTSMNNVHQAKTRVTKRLREVVQQLHQADET